MRRVFSKLNVFRRKGHVALPTEAEELKCLDRAIRDMTFFENSPKIGSISKHPLYSIALDIKPNLTETEDLHKNFIFLHDALHRNLEEYTAKIHNKLSVNDEDDLVAVESTMTDDNVNSIPNPTNKESQEQNRETVFRLTLSQHYFKALEDQVLQSEVSREQAAQKLHTLVDCLLVGTSSERLNGGFCCWSPCCK
jgi:hypothetical protein